MFDTVQCFDINKLLYAFKINTSLQSNGNTFGGIFWHLGRYYMTNLMKEENETCFLYKGVSYTWELPIRFPLSSC